MATEVGVGYVRLLPSMAGFSAAASRAMSAGIAAPAATAGRRAGDSLGTGIATGMAAGGRAISGFGDRVSRGVTLPVLGVGVAAVAMSGDFESGMNRVRAISGATGSDLDAMREQARELGSTTQFSATQAADAMGFLAMAGFDTNEIMSAMPGVLDMAAAAELDLAEAADIASNVLTGFGLSVDEVNRLNDVLVNTSQNANTDVRQLGDAFTYVGPVAGAAGMEIEETSAAIGLLADAGFQGEMGGTALRGAISRLINPTGEVESILSDLGVTVQDSSGQMLPFADILQQIEESGADAGDMMAMFGDRAGPGMLALVESGSDALRDLTEVNGEAGTAAESAAIRMEGFQGSTKELGSAFEGLMISIGDSGLLEWVTEAVQGLTGLFQAANETSPGLLRIATIAALLVAALGPVLSITGRMVTTMGQLGRGATAVARGTGRLASGLGRAGAAGARGLGRLASGFRSAQAAESAFSGRMGTIGGRLRQATNAFGRLAAAAGRAAAAVVRAGIRMAAQAAAAAARVVAQIALQIARWAVLAVSALASAASVALAWVISMGPIILVGAAIAGLVALVVIHFDTIKNAIETAFNWVRDNWQLLLAILTGPFGAAVWIITSHKDKIVDAVKAAIDWVKTNWPMILAIITGPIGLAVLAITRHWDKIKDTFNNVKLFIRNKIGDIVGYFRDLPGRIRRAASGAFNGLRDAFKTAINAIIGWWNGLSFTLPTIDIPAVRVAGRELFGGATIGGQTFSTPNIPTLHDGGIFQAPGGAREGLALLESGERVLPASAAGSPVSGVDPVRVILDVTGGDRDLVRLVQQWVRTSGGGRVEALAGK